MISKKFADKLYTWLDQQAKEAKGETIPIQSMPEQCWGWDSIAPENFVVYINGTQIVEVIGFKVTKMYDELPDGGFGSYALIGLVLQHLESDPLPRIEIGDVASLTIIARTGRDKMIYSHADKARFIRETYDSMVGDKTFIITKVFKSPFMPSFGRDPQGSPERFRDMIEEEQRIAKNTDGLC